MSPTSCESLHADVDVMCTDEGVGPVIFYFREPGQLQCVKPAAPAFQRLQGT